MVANFTLSVLCEMLSVSSRIWTHVTVSISYDDNHYTMGTSKNIVVWAYLKQGNSRAEWREGCDQNIESRSSTGLDKVHRQQVDLCSGQVVSKRLKMTTWKISTTMGRISCKTIQVNMEKNGKSKNKMEIHCGQWVDNKGIYIYIYI